MANVESNGEVSASCAESITMIDANALADLVGRSIASSDSLELKRAELLRDVSELLGADGWAVLSAPGERDGAGIPRAYAVKMESRLFSWHALSDLSSRRPFPLLWSYRTVATGDAVYVCLVRREGRKQFSARENRLFRILVEEVPWLYEETLEVASTLSIPEMAPRRRMIFDLLRQGFDRKEIAEQLAISVHTVSDHQKAIYRLLEVNSQIALMRRYRYP